MHKYKRLEDNPGAVINTDVQALKAYKAKKAAMIKHREEFEDMKQDVKELKQMLSLIMEKINK